MTVLAVLLLQLLFGFTAHPTPLVNVPQPSGGVVYQCTTPAADVCTIPPLTITPGVKLP